VKVTEQLASPEVPAGSRVQVDEEKRPWELVWNETVPVGVTGDPAPLVSITVTVQTVAELRATGFGAQLTELETERWLTFKFVL